MIDYCICKITACEAKQYICENHYSHGCHNGPSPCYGLFDGEKLIGVCAFAVPCSERVRASVFGVKYKNHVIELHRLHILDCTPKNTESWFISRCLKLLKRDKPEIWAVISFSDLTAGHTGVIYKASNAYRLGETEKKRFYIDENGRLRHPRQNGHNVTAEEAKTRGWTSQMRGAKNRFLWVLPDGKRVSETKQTVVYKKRIPAILFPKEQRRNSNVSVHHSTDEWRAIFDQRIQSGLSVRQWCDQNSMKYDTYKYWEKKIRSFDHAAQTASEPAFVELPDLPQLINSVPPIKIGYRDFQISIQPSADLKQISGVLKLLHSL